MAAFLQRVLWCLGVAFALSLAAAPARAEGSVAFDIQPRLARVGEPLQATLTVRGIQNPSNPGFPQLDGFDIQGSSQNLSIENGAVSVTFSYTLIPRRTGRFSIGPFTYSIGDKNYDLPAVDLQIVEATAPPPGQGEDVFAVLEPSTTNLYVQQVFDLVLKVYVSTRLRLANIGSLQGMPAQLQLRTGGELNTIRESIDGQIYDVRRIVLRAQPLTSGLFELKEVAAQGEFASSRRRRGPFGDDFIDSFFNAVQTEARSIPIRPLVLNIRPLPESGRPAGFSGAVGQFTFEASCQPLEVAAGDPLNLRVRLAGQGNIANVQPPAFALGDGFKVYEGRLQTENVDASAARGEKVFEQVVIPKSTDVKEIPALSFSYFDPAADAYRTITRGPFPLVVKPGAQAQAAVFAPSGASVTPTAATTLGSDIVYLKPAPRRWSDLRARPWFAHPAFLAAQALPALLTLGTWLVVRRRQALRTDIRRARRLAAPRVARAALTRARTVAGQGDARALHEALWEAMSLYFGNRLNLAPGEVSAERVLAAFGTALSADDAKRLRSLFETGERARFGGPAHANPSELGAHIEDLETLMRLCERIRL